MVPRTAPSPVRTPRLTPALLLALAAHCGGASTGALRERIGGALRERAFASPTAYEAYLRAELAMARSDPAGAAAQMDLALIADASDGFLAARRVEVLLARPDRAEALRAGEAASRQHPESAAVWLALAEARAANGDEPGTRDALQRAATLDPEDPDVRAALSARSGGSAQEVARARRDAPDARVGDRTVANAALLDPGADARRASLSRRRLQAIALRARGDWAGVDHLLTPAALRDPTNLADRELVIEARARDGRPRDAAALVSTLPRAAGDAQLPLARRARAWWLAGDAPRAADAAAEALTANPDDPVALRVRAQALAAQGDARGALALLARVTVDAPWAWAGELARDEWDVPGRDLIDAAGRDVSDAHRAFASARRVAADLLARGGRTDLAAAVLSRALDAIARAPDGAASRDALRLRLAELRPPGAERDAALDAVETTWGRHRRAVRVMAVAPARALEDLRARSGDEYEDANADAWRVIVCASSPGRCAEREAREALDRAARDAPTSPVTRRAQRWTVTPLRTEGVYRVFRVAPP